LLKEEEETKTMAGSDPEMQKLAEDELKNIAVQKEEFMKQMEEIVKAEEKEEEFTNEIILEVRAGAGGEEASIFAKEIADMYIAYAKLKGRSEEHTSELQ